ncbi:MAG: hypothetical protein KIS85_08075 [Anaerolineales bacterium]|nr:hypothetical protein [Anaerolineales bacterium]
MKNPFSSAEWMFVLLCAALSAALGLAAAAPFGLGVSGDGVAYLSTADSFAAGEGIIDYRGDPMVNWAPLYSAVVGGVKRLSGSSALAAAQFINLVSGAAVVFSTALLFKTTSFKHSMWFYAATLATAVFPSLLYLNANVGSDMLFMALVMAFLLAIRHYYAEGRRADFVWALALVAIATTVRWAGLVFVAAGVLLVSLRARRDEDSWLRPALTFGGAALLPFLAWTLGHNYLLTGTLLGPRVLGDVLVASNLLFAYQRISEWFLPDMVSRHISLAALAGLALAAAWWLTPRAAWRAWGQRMLSAELLPVWLSAAIYLGFVALTTFTHDHVDHFDDRYQVMMLPALLLCLFVGIEELAPRPRRWRAYLRGLGMAGLAVWVAWLGLNSYKFIAEAQEAGVPYYNVFNVESYYNSGFVRYLQRYAFEEGVPLYSNASGAVYLHIGRRAARSPLHTESGGTDMQYLYSEYGDWPEGGRGYLVWFYLNPRSNYYLPEMLENLAELELIFSEPDGVLFRLGH